MRARVLAGLFFPLAIGTGTAVAVTPLEPARTGFVALPLASPEPRGGLERRWWGMAIRTSGDDVPFPEREPAVLVAGRDVDPETQLVRSVVIVVRTARASGWMGGPGASAKVDALREEALAAARTLLDDPAAREVGEKEGVADSLGAVAASVPPDLQGSPRLVAVVPLGSDWPALDRALAYTLTESLVKANAARVIDVDTAERVLGDLLGVQPATERESEPPLAAWAQALGVDAIAGVRATSVRAVASADDGADVLSAEVLWSKGDGGVDRNTTTLKVKHRTYPARGKLKVVLRQAHDLSEEMIPRLPPPGTNEEALYAARDLPWAASARARETANAGAMRVGERRSDLADRDPRARASRTGTTEHAAFDAPGFRADSGGVRDVPVAGARRTRGTESASLSGTGERGTSAARDLSAGRRSGSRVEAVALAELPADGSLQDPRSVDGVRGRRGGAFEDPVLGDATARDGDAGRDVDGAGRRRSGTLEDPALGDGGTRDGDGGRDVDGAGRRRAGALDDPSLADGAARDRDTARNADGAGRRRANALDDASLADGAARDGDTGRDADGPGRRRGGALEDAAIADVADRDGAKDREANGGGRRRGEGEALAMLPVPGTRPEDASGALDWCAMLPKARSVGDDGWIVYHPLNRARIIADGDPMLEEIAKRLAADRGARVRVIGHTCNVGDPGYNLSLGSRRSDMTRDRLIQLGVPEARIDATSEGLTNPACTNETRVGRMNNRRTEIRIEAGSDRSEER